MAIRKKPPAPPTAALDHLEARHTDTEPHGPPPAVCPHGLDVTEHFQCDACARDAQWGNT